MATNYVLLNRQTLSSAVATVTFSNIPQTGYTDLKIVISGRDSSSAGTSGNGYSFTIKPNGATTNITQRSLFAGSPVGVGSYSDSSMFNTAEMSSDTANTFSNVEIYIPNYTTANAKAFTIDGVTEGNQASTAIRLSAGLWNQTTAISSLELTAYSTWTANSSFALYGIAKLGTTPTVLPKAYGGDIVVNDGTYWYHAFLSSGAFTPLSTLTCDALVVAGGGGGSGWDFAGGGGGAGGLQAFASQIFSTSQVITVGAGGRGTTVNYTIGGNGGNSAIGSLTASVGGGGGGASNNANSTGATGGSGGGGGAGGTALGGSASPAGQGNAGGNGYSAGQKYPGGGGGGAGANGSNSGTASGGAGGIGLNTKTGWGTFSAMVSATGLGASGYFAGGGGGGVYAQYGGGATVGAGGTGGGGSGGVGESSIASVAGTAGTGGGGGGNGAGNNASNGGSGIVIIRYTVA